MHHVNVCFIHDSSINHTKIVLFYIYQRSIKLKYHCKSYKITWLLVHYEGECNMRLCWSDGNLYHSENKLWQTPIHWLTNWSQMLIEHSEINWPNRATSKGTYWWPVNRDLIHFNRLLKTKQPILGYTNKNCWVSCQLQAWFTNKLWKH